MLIQLFPSVSTNNNIDIRDALAETSFLGAYRGFFSKMIFNLPYAGALYTTATGDSYSWAFWLATIALYPFNTLKVMSQVGDRPQAFSQITYRGFRGVVPFALLNIVFCWQLTGLFTPERLQNLKK
jgi:hypothetical protein